MGMRVSQHASGVEVEVYEGVESVLLPCEISADVSRSSTAAVWSHKELIVPTVHVRLHSGDEFERQNNRYTDRTSMRADALQTGDLSLTLRNPTVSDSGTYTCTTRRFGQDQTKIHVQLKVTEPPPAWTKVLPGVLVPVVLLAAGFGVFMYYRYKIMKSRKDYPLEIVEVTQEEKSVLLPFKFTEDLPQDVRVEWKHRNKKVHEYQSNQNQPLLQDQDHRDRTEMNEDPLRAKDLSLTLKDPQLSDHGGYTCTVYNKGGDILLHKVVSLNMTVPEVQMVETVKGVQSVVLPFKAEVRNPEDVTVEWKHKDKKVHEYQRGRNQSHIQGRSEMKTEQINTGDLSLTLKDLQLTDSGVYTCTVCNKDGHMLLQKVVTLSVRDYQAGVVEVTQGQKSVLMPFKITDELPPEVKVQWRLTHPEDKMVLLYDSSQKQPLSQDQVYGGRTEMPDNALKNKDLSLTLKDLQLTDSGVYTCTVCNKDGLMLLQKSVTLSVRVPEEQVKGKVKESVVLPFKAEVSNPEDVTVEWKHKDKKVHEYQRGRNQSHIQGRSEMKKEQINTGDLSLTLKDLQPTDSGVYTCTVCNKDEDILLQKVFSLRVKESLRDRFFMVQQEGSTGQ
ncbi:titin-like [Archocentrus centrarchus]|uniref:titin-like n=1 Tax=Archocentrus centrarchus TaxID=63155 RepID=UPI0011E9F7E2|nr:titin-like [Archocentrus centrarchus]